MLRQILGMPSYALVAVLMWEVGASHMKTSQGRTAPVFRVSIDGGKLFGEKDSRGDGRMQAGEVDEKIG